jgi:predicted RNA binding protein YcfA (HicA-like mRNA interferase family)
MKYKEITKIVLNDGWYLVHQVGSHRQYKHPTKRGKVTIAGKPSEDVLKKTEQNILKQAGLRK